MDFGDLKDDKAIQQKLTNFHNSVEKITQILQKTQDSEIYETLSIKEKIDYDLFQAYTLNTLFWLYLRNRNEDPNQNDIKNQLNRVKDYMVKAKQAYERQTLRPKLDQPAVKRFVKHAINHMDKSDHPPNKKIKFSD